MRQVPRPTASEEVTLFRLQFGQAARRLAMVKQDLVKLDLAGNFQRPLRRQWVTTGLETHPQHAVKHQGEEADQRMNTDAIRQPVVDRHKLDVALQQPETALYVRQRSVALSDLLWVVVRHFGDQQQFAIQHAGAIGSR